MINADYTLLRENIFHFKQREKYVKRNRTSINYELTSDGLMVNRIHTENMEVMEWGAYIYAYICNI